MFSRFQKNLSVCMASALFALPLSAKQPPPFGDSLSWKTGKETPSLEALRGKSVIVVFFQDWCPICNGWSGEFFRQMGEAYGNDPAVVLVAIKTDGGKVSDALDYLKGRTDPDRWLVAVDENATYYRQATGANKLYYYMRVAPDGSIGEVAQAGSYYGEESAKRYALAAKETQPKVRKGASPLMAFTPPLPEALAPAVRMAENGLFLGALGEAAKLASNATLRGDITRFRQRIAELVQSSVERHSAALADEGNENRYLSYLALRGIEKNFGTSPSGQAARTAASAQARSPWILNEEKAEADYKAIMRRAARADDTEAQARIDKSLEKLAATYPGTQYGRIATNAAKD